MKCSNPMCRGEIGEVDRYRPRLGLVNEPRPEFCNPDCAFIALGLKEGQVVKVMRTHVHPDQRRPP